ncbi:hypothetical protein TEHN7118_0657 [Tetragenococcus halophilus subsp. halophilus]|uniref:Ketose-bisphosphate aldolase n=1 Tax=Tetragenococcus halophilus subsp. halophilus TaxID=1513897 RepID=A0A2H6CS90_TETHA|nr:class II aldolase [Tetragenococcus halophilus]GBD67851.1 hypothetical protein TEHN7118_0657 [Tetragenococcus halophilus subsp. halophilus]
MQLVNGYKLMEYAKENQIVLPAFNTTNYELTQGIIQGIQKAKLGGYIAISSSNLELSSPRMIADMVKFAMKDAEVPVALHLDHGKSFQDVKDCIDAGFTSIMVDASHLPFEQNIAEVNKIVNYCHFFNIPVEAELGAIGGKEETELGEEGKTDPSDVKEFIEKTNCDLLAVSVGNVHGLDIQPNLDFELLEEIHNISSVPLVLHGGSGIPYDQVRRTRENNLLKVNYGSDLRNTFIRTFGKSFETNHKIFDVKSLSKKSIQNISNKVIEISKEVNCL